MCNAESALLGAKLVTDIGKEKQEHSANVSRSRQTAVSNHRQAILINESLKAKQVSSLRQEAQEEEKASKKIATAFKKARAERAAIKVRYPYQGGVGTLEALLRDSQRIEFETKASISNNLQTLKHSFRTGRQIDILNTGTQLAALPIPDAVGDPTLSILGAVADSAPAIYEESKRT